MTKIFALAVSSWLKLASSVVSSSCRLNFVGLVFNFSTTWLRISSLMSFIRLLTTLFDSGAKESLSLAAFPSIILANCSAAGLTSVSPMVCGFPCFQLDMPLHMMQ